GWENTTGALPSRPRQATTRHQRHPLHARLAGAVVRLAPRSRCRATGNVPAVAAPRVPTVLARHTIPGTAPAPRGAARTHPAEGACPSYVGPATHGQRTGAQARPAGLTETRAPVHAHISGSSARPPRAVAALAPVPGHSHPLPRRPWHGHGPPHPRCPSRGGP